MGNRELALEPQDTTYAFEFSSGCRLCYGRPPPNSGAMVEARRLIDVQVPLWRQNPGQLWFYLDVSSLYAKDTLDVNCTICCVTSTAVEVSLLDLDWSSAEVLDDWLIPAPAGLMNTHRFDPCCQGDIRCYFALPGRAMPHNPSGAA